MKLRTGDTVLVIKGKDRGKRGTIQHVLTKDSKLLVEGINMVTKHAKATGGVRQAGIIQKEMPIWTAKVELICVHCDKPSKIARRMLPDGTKARVCKKCSEIIE